MLVCYNDEVVTIGEAAGSAGIVTTDEPSGLQDAFG